jgi:UDP-2,3-diacylglucosamine pyrophosphatase LpxH
MFSYNDRIGKVYRQAEAIRIDDLTKIVVMSDVHRGSGNWADDFAKNQLVYSAALKSYNRQGYTYIELGDGDELWKSKRLTEMESIHKDVFELLEQFYRDRRLYMMFGNHDIVKKLQPGLMNVWGDGSGNGARPLFPGIRLHEGLRLKHMASCGELFLLHGHQADLLNDTLWRLARFLVRHVWKPLELVGFDDPTSANKNNKVKDKVEKRLQAWAEEKGTLLMAGHTHRAVFPKPGEGRYFNDGSCVRPWSITAIEIADGRIALVKWAQKTNDDSAVVIGKDILEGPYKLTEYFL